MQKDGFSLHKTNQLGKREVVIPDQISYNFFMDEEKREGIILQVVPFQDFHEIANLFGPEGSFSIIRKWGRSKKKAPLQPLTRVEIVLTLGRGDLHTATEISELDPYLKLRDDYKVLTCSMEALEAIRKTQITPPPNTALYQLFKGSLERMHLAPQNLLSTLYLKILLHEGMLPEDRLTLPMTDLLINRSWSALIKLTIPDETHEEVKILFLDCIT